MGRSVYHISMALTSGGKSSYQMDKSAGLLRSLYWEDSILWSL